MSVGSREAADGGIDVLRPSRVSTGTTASAVVARGSAQPSVLPSGPSRHPLASSRTARSGSRAIYGRVLAAVDAVAAFLAGVAVLGGGPVRLLDFVLCCALVLVWPLVIAGNGGYERGFVGAGNAEFSRVFRAFLQLTAGAVFAVFLAGLHPSRAVLVPMLGLVFALTCLGRYVARKVLHRQRRQGRSLTPVVAVGDVESVVTFATLLRRDWFAGLEVVGACFVAPPAPDSVAADELRYLGVRDLGSVQDVAIVAREFEAPTVAVLDGAVGPDELRRIGWQLEGSRAHLVVSPGLAELGGRRMHIRPVAGLPLLHIDEPSFTGVRRLLKGAFDVVTAALALLVLSPLLLLIGLAVRITSRGPALFRQTRVGRNGREFTMLKFRSMCVDAEDRLPELVTSADDGNGVLFKLRDDPRVTPLGRILRRVSLDELPQLINVVTGSMSLVGPRPPLPAEVERYHDDARRRLLVKPGLTGLWQISGRSDLSWEESVRLDLRYVEDWSLSLDLIVLWKTARAVLRADGAY